VQSPFRQAPISPTIQDMRGESIDLRRLSTSRACSTCTDHCVHGFHHYSRRVPSEGWLIAKRNGDLAMALCSRPVLRRSLRIYDTRVASSNRGPRGIFMRGTSDDTE